MHLKSFFTFCKLSLTKVKLFAFKTVWLYDFHSNFSNIRWTKFIDAAIQMLGGGGGGVLLGILGGAVPPSSPNPDPISDQKMPFSTSVFRPGGGHKTQQHKTEIMSLLLRLKPQQKEFLKSISNSHITLSFLWIWT